MSGFDQIPVVATGWFSAPQINQGAPWSTALVMGLLPLVIMGIPTLEPATAFSKLSLLPRLTGRINLPFAFRPPRTNDAISMKNDTISIKFVTSLARLATGYIYFSTE